MKQCLVRGDSFLSSEITVLEVRLHGLLRDLEGAKIRSKAQWIESGEKPTRYFFRLERERFTKNNLTSILDEHNVEVFARDEIAQAHVHFYTTLFSEQQIDPACKEQCYDSFLVMSQYLF